MHDCGLEKQRDQNNAYRNHVALAFRFCPQAAVGQLRSLEVVDFAAILSTSAQASLAAIGISPAQLNGMRVNGV